MKATVTTNELLEAIKKLEGSIAKRTKTNTNNILTNICIKVKDYYFELVSTDGNSLTMVRINPNFDGVFDKNLIDKNFIVPLDNIKKAIDNKSRAVTLDLIDDDDNKNKSVAIDNNNGLVSKIPCIAGCYPKYEQLMPYRDSYDQIKRDDDDVVRIAITKEYLLNILKSYAKSDERIELEIPKDNYKYIGIRPRGVNSGKTFTMLMPVIIR